MSIGVKELLILLMLLGILVGGWFLLLFIVRSLGRAWRGQR